MVTNFSVEGLLNYKRLLRTLREARRFDQAGTTPDSTDGQSQFNMRSAMDISPTTGKWISRKSITKVAPVQWQLADFSASRFIDAAEISQAVSGIQRDGFYVFDRVIEKSITDAIRGFAEQAPCTARGAGASPATYPRSSPAVGRYDFAEEISLQCAEVQEFATDPAMARIAQCYLGQPVLMDEVALWWTTARRAEDANINAQLFHQDRDRLSFLKFFIYLTDVTPENGPHVYLKGSHRKIPRRLRGDGRKTDDAVRQSGLWENVVELTGPAGTLMAVDTIGLHKGKTPLTGDRLALENEFATSLFGADYELPTFSPTQLTRNRFHEMPWIFQRYEASVRECRSVLVSADSPAL